MNPVLVEVLRSAPGNTPHVESRHHARLVVADAAGRRVFGLGDTAAPVFPRSAIKLIQALPLVESGAADALGLTTAELALAAASHNGEPIHVETARAMLARVGRDETCLACGPQWPEREVDRGPLWREGRAPTRLHNNCSGKHAGFVCFACHTGLDLDGYEAPDHPVQREITATLEDVARLSLADAPRGRDGCSIPAYALPLDAVAAAMARFGSGEGLAPGRARAAKRLLDAARAEPFMIAGHERLCTDLIEAFDGAIYVKVGAEGVYTAILPTLGLAIALKAEDGARRAAEVLIAELVARLMGRADDEALAPFLRPQILDRNGVTVGEVRLAPGVLDALPRFA